MPFLEGDEDSIIWDSIITLAKNVRCIHEELTKVKEKVDSMVKNAPDHNDETLFLKNYWPWKDESQMKKAETDMIEDKTQFNRTVIIFEITYTNYYSTFIILFYLFITESPIYNVK